MAGAEQEAEEERAAHTAFDTEQQHRQEAVDGEEESDYDDYWSGPDPEEKTAEKMDILA
jgi:hypothetical protein